jgi:rod shape-determining protein MreC
MVLGHIQVSKHSLFWGLLVLSILIYVIPQKITNSLNLRFYSMFDRILQVGRNFPSDSSPAAVASNQTVDKSEYDSLWKEYKNIQAQMAELEKENLTLSRIRKQYGFPKSGFLTALSTVLIRSARQELIINRGAEQGVAAGQLVLSPNKDSIIGIIKEVSETIARVGLLTDSAVSIGVLIRRDNTKTEIPAQMFGDGKNGCQIRFISRKTDIRKGDTVYAAAHPGKLEIPIVIGRIRDAGTDEQNPLLWSVSVEPIEQASALKEVIVLIPLTQ